MNKRQLIKAYKRMLFTLLITLVPVVLVLEYFIKNSANSTTKIALYVLIGGAVVALVEFIRYNKNNKIK